MKVFLDTIGCRLNQSEIESMAGQFRAAGHEIVGTSGEADLVVVNTCAVTSRAAADSRAKIRQAARSGVEDIVATGCWTTLEPHQAANLAAGVRVVSNQHKENLVPRLLDIPPEDFDLEPIAREPLPGVRRRTRAFIKVQDGCDNRCTFCVTTLARGSGRSRPITRVIADIQSALDGGTKEIVLTGVHLGSWGLEFGLHLRDLVGAILTDTDTPRLRLSSLEPWDLDEDFFHLWEDERLCQHLHLPLQSGSAHTLRRMARKTTPASFRGLVSAARQVIPEAAITTDVIAGFPGETEDEFAESLEFIRALEFAGGHAFMYSPRPGTAAARMEGQIRSVVRKERNAILRGVFEQGARVYRQRFIGRQVPVLWESSQSINGQGWELEGLTGNYLRVRTVVPVPLWNRISMVELGSEVGNSLHGAILNADP